MDDQMTRLFETGILLFLFFVGSLIIAYWHTRQASRQPMCTRKARLLKKEQEIFCKANAKHPVYDSLYRVVFEINETAERLTLGMGLSSYVMLEEGETGVLTYRGEQFVDFNPDIPRKDSKGNERHGSEILTGIDVVCEECGRATNFPLGQLGTVRQCAHCRAYIDVED